MIRTSSHVRWLGVLAALLLLALSHASLLAQSGADRFYYYKGTRIPLSVNPRLIAVRFDTATLPEAQRDIVNAAGDVQDFDARESTPVGGLDFLSLRAGSNPIQAAARLNARSGVGFASPVYQDGVTQAAETNEFLVRFKSALTDADIAVWNQSNNVSVARPQPNADRVLVLRPNAGNSRSGRELANLYVEAGKVDFAEPNFVIRQPPPTEQALTIKAAPPVFPSDTYFSSQWGLYNTGSIDGSTVRADINATNAWGITQGASAIKIAIIDEGVQSNHEDLSGKVLSGYNALDQSGNTTPKLNNSHGTAVAGVAAALSNNAVGIAGVCWNCRILPIKVAEADNAGNWTTSNEALAAGIDWAWQHGADVLNNSWTMQFPSDAVELAILNARTAGRDGKGSTIVFATGNENKNTVSFPASLNAYVIAVGASNLCDARKTPTNDKCNNRNTAWGSNYGTALDLLAPGEAIYSTCTGAKCGVVPYTYFSGTSLAAPSVSGSAGLLYSLNPNLTPDKVQQALQRGAKDLGASGKDLETGHGRLDAYAALGQLYNLNLTVTDGKVLAHSGDTLAYILSYANTGSTAMGMTEMSVTLPTNTAYVSSTPSFTNQGGGVYKLNLGTLPASTTSAATFRVQVQPSAAGLPITLNASIAGAFPEATQTDNQASDVTLGIKQQFYFPLIENAALP